MYRILEGGLNSKMATNNDVIQSSSVNAVKSLEGIYNEINVVTEVYRNNSSNFEISPMKLSEEISRIY